MGTIKPKGPTIINYNPRELNRTLWYLSYPTLLSLVLHNGFGVFEATLISYSSTENLTVLSLGSPIALIFTNFAMGLGIGVNSLTARLIGREAWGRNSKAVCLAFALVTGMVMAGLGLLLISPVLHLLDTPEALCRATMSYLMPLLLGGPAYFLFAAAGGLLQGMGRIGDSARAMVAAIAINAALDPVLLYGFSFLPKLGLPGIAISGVLARTCGFALQAGWYLRRPPLPQAALAGARSGEIVRDILNVTIPTSISRSSQPLSLILLNSLMLTLGPAVVAARGLGARLDTIAHLPSLAITPAVVALVGQNWGAGYQQSARAGTHRAALLVGGIMLGVGLFVALWPSLVWNAVAPDPALQGPGYGYLRFLGATYFLVGMDMVYSAALQGLGLGYPVLVVTLVRVWVISLPFAYLFVGKWGWGAEGVWLALALGNVWSGLAAAVWFRRASATRASLGD